MPGSPRWGSRWPTGWRGCVARPGTAGRPGRVRWVVHRWETSRRPAQDGPGTPETTARAAHDPVRPIVGARDLGRACDHRSHPPRGMPPILLCTSLRAGPWRQGEADRCGRSGAIIRRDSCATREQNAGTVSEIGLDFGLAESGAIAARRNNVHDPDARAATVATRRYSLRSAASGGADAGRWSPRAC